MQMAAAPLGLESFGLIHGLQLVHIPVKLETESTLNKTSIKKKYKLTEILRLLNENKNCRRVWLSSSVQEMMISVHNLGEGSHS
jgi:hypothetical protein